MNRHCYPSGEGEVRQRMNERESMDPAFLAELQELLAAARGMTDGHFQRMVTVRTRGVVGELAAAINLTLQNLQSLDPTVRGSSREIPKVAQHLGEIIQTTEEATNRVLEQAEHLVEDQAQVHQGLSRASEMLHSIPNASALKGCLQLLHEVETIQRQSQGRAMEIMAAMEFQDLTTQKIQKLIALVAEVEGRLRQLLVMFRIEDAVTGEQAPDRGSESTVQNQESLCGQEMVDQLLSSLRSNGV